MHRKYSWHSAKLKKKLPALICVKEVQDAQPRADRRVQTGHQAAQGFTGPSRSHRTGGNSFRWVYFEYHEVTSPQSGCGFRRLV